MSDNRNIQDQQLADALASKDSAAFEQLYDQYAGILYGTILRILKSKELAEDVLQEVVVKIWQNINRFDAHKGSLLTWMLRIARNRAIDVYRSAAFQKGMQQKEELEDRDAPAISTNVETIGVKKLLDQLEPNYKQVIELAYFEGYTQAEMADKLNLPLGTIKSRVRIGLRELRKLTQD